MRPSQATIRNQRIRIRGKTSTKEKDSKSTRKDSNDDSSDPSPSSSSRSSSTSRGSNPRRFRIRPAVGQNRGGEEVKKETVDNTEEDSATRPRVSSPRRGSLGSRGRRPVAGRTSTSKAPQRSSTLAPSTTITSTIPPTTTQVVTTTSEWTTTTEKVTINPNAHHISYTLADAETGGDDSLIEDVIVELGCPDYLEVEPDEEKEKTAPVAEELRSVVPVPADVFSQATHQLMKNKKITPDPNEPSFRPTLLPQRTTIGRRTGGTTGRKGETTGRTGTTGRRGGTTGRRIGGRRTSPRTIEEQQDTTAWTRANADEPRTSTWTDSPIAPSSASTETTETMEVGITEQQVIKEFVEDFKEKELKKETLNNKRKQHFLSPEERRKKITGISSRRRSEEPETEGLTDIESDKKVESDPVTTSPLPAPAPKRGRFILAIGANG